MLKAPDKFQRIRPFQFSTSGAFDAKDVGNLNMKVKKKSLQKIKGPGASSIDACISQKNQHNKNFDAFGLLKAGSF